jgi:hypothetical protein
MALAAFMGVVGGQSDFGGDFGGDFGDDFDGDFGADFGDFGTFGDDYGFGADAPAAAPIQVAKAVSFYKKAAAAHAHGMTRKRLLNPNEGSSVKIERYAFNLSTTLTLGVVFTLNITGQPDYEIRPQRVIMNAPAPGFVVINEIKMANVSVTSGGSEDAFGYSAQAQGSELDMPTLTPANRATVLGGYTGFVPPGYVGGNAFLFSASFRGPANLAG